MYSHDEIEKMLNYDIQLHPVECNFFTLSELRKLLEDGWVIYDTQVTSDKDIKILTLARSKTD